MTIDKEYSVLATNFYCVKGAVIGGKVTVTSWSNQYSRLALIVIVVVGVLNVVVVVVVVVNVLNVLNVIVVIVL